MSPLFPPNPVALRKKSSMSAKVTAWVMMEKYTPRMRERKAKNPKTSAAAVGDDQDYGQGVPEMLEPVPEPGNLVPVHELHELGQAFLPGDAVVAQKVHAHGVAAQGEEHAMPQA